MTKFTFLDWFDNTQRKHRTIRRYLLKNYGQLITDFQQKQYVSHKFTEPYPVWVCWWQGGQTMPPLVKACYNSLRRNANGHTVNLLTKDNYQKFVQLPPFVLEKTAQGKITITHLSDILRMALLAKYGGLWIDSTVLITTPLPDFAETDLFSLKRARDNKYVAECRWSAYFWYMTRGHLLADFLNTMFTEYWRRENDLIAFFLIDYCIALAYDFLPAVQKQIGDIPYNNPQVHTLQKNLGLAYADKFFEELCLQNQFHKLTWKKDFPDKTETGQLTFYGKILQDYL